MIEEDQRNPVDAWYIDKFRPFAKGWFEIVRNAFVVALLNYIASKSDSGAFKLLAFFTYLLFATYCMSFVILAQPATRSSAKKRWVRWAADILSFAFSAVGIYYWSDIFTKALDQLVKVQFK